ncbi:MAG: hypothetical protein ABEJ58_07760 [Halodesulfurarchaeum sp.]
MTAETSRGQAHTLEGIAAAILVLGSVVFALQVTAVTPLTASTASQHIENQQRAVASGVLSIAKETGALDSSVRYWNETGVTFHGTPAEGYYLHGGPPNRFGSMLNDSFGEAGIAFNVDVTYLTPSGAQRNRRMVYQGTPSDHAVVVGRTVVLYDDDVLLDASGNETDTTLGETNGYFAPDMAPSSHVYNVLRVEVTVWQM